MDNNNSSTAYIGLNRILSADINDITKTFIEDMFASYHDKQTNTFKQANFNATDLVDLSSEQYKWVNGKITTTLGTVMFNRYVLEKTGIIEHLGYWNRPLDKKGLEALTVAINNLCLMDTIDTKMLGAYTDARDRFGFWSAAFLSVSISAGLIRPMDNVNKRKAELFKEYQDALNSNNPVDQIMAVNKIEKELMTMVRSNLKGDTGYDLYRSGDGNLDNNYKTINVMRGAVFNNATKRYDIVESSLMNGVKKKDIAPFANSVVAAAYPSAVGTADAGYMSKIILALLQSEQIDPDPNSDCGTTSTIPLTITKKNKQYALFRYINDGGKRVLTTLENIDSYIGKTVNLYSPQCCRNDKICGKCAGRVFHNLGVTQIGLLVTQITQKLLNLKLKAKHDLSQSAGIIPEAYAFLHKNSYAYIDERTMLKNKVTMKMFIPRILDEENNVSLFYREPTCFSCIGVIPVKFYDGQDNEIFSTLMTIPAMMTFNLYSDIQEDIDTLIVTYEPDSDICRMGIQQNVSNVELFINQIYLYSKIPQIPYNLLTEMMFRCLEINNIDLTGPAITYELLAKRVCRKGMDSFAKAFGNNPNIDQMSYDKKKYREAVQESGVLQGVLFQDISNSMNVGLAQTLNGIKPTESPLEKIIKA